jgi:N6-adenosine-specific RNA methylase IME4
VTSSGLRLVASDDVVEYAVALDKRVDAGEHDAVWARWEFGRWLLGQRGDVHGRMQLPDGLLTRLTEATGKSRRELQYRVLFAERYPTRERVRNALRTLQSWHEIVSQGLKGSALDENDAPLLTPVGQYRCLTADPPWPYDNRATRGAATDHYPTLTIPQLCGLELLPDGTNLVSDVITPVLPDGAHLYLWTTSAFLREAFDVLVAWGFAYKTSLVWVKPQMGIGNYFRSQHEFVLFGVRGTLRVQDGNQASWFEAKRGRHSAKPERFYELVETVSPGPYLELFGRPSPLFGPREGWSVWGNEACQTH